MAGGTIKGITVEIGGNTGPLNKALGDVDKTSRGLQNELRQVERLLKLDPTNTELLAQKQKLLADSVDNTKSKLNTLKEAEKQVQEQVKQGKISEEQYRAFQREVAKTEIELKKIEDQAKKTNKEIDFLGEKSEKMNNFMKGATVAAAGIGTGLIGMAVQAGAAADDINTLAKQTGLSTEQIQKFQYASDRIDVSMETLTGSMAKLTRNMESARQGSKNQEEAFKALGITITDNEGKLRDNQDVFNEVIDALGKMENETQRDALAMQIFGKSAQDLNPLILGGAEDLKKYGEEAEAAGLILSQEALDGANAFADGVDKLKATAMSSFGVIGGQIAEKLVPAIENLSKLIENVVRWIVDNQAIVLATITAIGVGLAAWNIVTMVQGIIGFTKALEGATLAQKLFNLAMTANPIALIATLVAGLVAAIIVLWNTNEDFRDAIIGIWEKIKSAVFTAVEKVKGVFNTVIDFIKGNWQALLLMIVNPFAGAFKLLYDNCDGFKNFVDGFVNDVVKFFKGLPGKVWNAIIGIKDKFNNLKSELINWANNNLPSFIAKFVGFMLELPNKMANIGKNIVEGIWNGMTGAVGWLKDKITGFANGIVNSIKSVLDIHSPSRVLADEVGKYMAQGIGMGFEAEMGSVSSNMAKAIPVNKKDYIPGNNSSSSGSGHPGDYNQTVNIYSPTPLTPAEVARQTRNASRRLVLGV
ncbi:phage tail protein [Ruminiclostridium papyrosolvens]|uniref:Uncharacterized protein n=1 Tax=Ruminiclostridium papyrosolvens C7 TaxID=1330534 RepID=U4QWP5_9FIRM|nr:phage tail tape measure protein [Ruminiclostridium papyrosolvens]EPR07744.1 hypothetical protein L323_19715 [Ruminiclostridium papyrosolvens C7]